MSYVRPAALEALVGSALFYPGAGTDWREPLEFFAPTIIEFWFVDVAYFSRRPADSVPPLLQDSPNFEFKEFVLTGPATAEPETRIDPSSGDSYPFIEPCTRTEVYLHRPTNASIQVHRRRGFAQRSIALVSDIGVFFYRRDSSGEGGSHVHWLSPRWFPQVATRLRPGALARIIHE